MWFAVALAVFVIIGFEHVGREFQWSWKPSLLLNVVATCAELVWNTTGRWFAIILEHINILQFLANLWSSILQTMADLWAPIQRFILSPRYLIRGYFDYVENPWVYTATVLILLALWGFGSWFCEDNIFCGFPALILLFWGLYEYHERQSPQPTYSYPTEEIDVHRRNHRTPRTPRTRPGQPNAQPESDDINIVHEFLRHIDE